MNVPPNELLRMLAGGVNPVARASAVDTSGGSSLDFRAMLEKAAGGELKTGLPVRAPLGLSPPIGAGEQDALSVAADRAQAAGIDRALIQLAGRSYRVDVRERAVIDAPDAQLRAVGDIDGYVRAGDAAEKSPDQAGSRAFDRGAIGPARVVRNTSLIDALARVRPGVD